ncbi:unnamed protein product [Nyctereutes procyonoides]|uniref:60S ribosomal protein L3 n=1 Tax=Nyctereutes procyonoides TaxID=34880 RepID=A0A811ZR03_NYCPR|nr:unnamed protein product [Nyctereutes procyonoides]
MVDSKVLQGIYNIILEHPEVPEGKRRRRRRRKRRSDHDAMMTMVAAAHLMESQLQRVTGHWHTKKLPHKTGQRLHKVACTGAWHSKSYHHHTEMNKIYKIGQSYLIKDGKVIKNNASTDYHMSDGSINSLGGFVHYSEVINAFVRLKGCVLGTKSQQLIFCKSSLEQTKGQAQKTDLSFTTEFGSVSFQTVEEKKAFMGPLKKDQIANVRNRLCS